VRSSFLLTLAVLLLILGSCGDSGKTNFEKGLVALKAGNPSMASGIFESIISKTPDSPYGNHGMAVYFDKEALLYEALNANYEVMKDHPNFLPALALDAELSLKIGRPELAFLTAALYQKKGGDKSLGASLEAEALIEAGKISEAGISLEKALKELPNDPLLLLARGRYYYHNNNFPKAEQDFRDAVAKSDNKPEILKPAGDFCKMMGLYDSAAYFYNQALKAAGDDFYYMGDIAQALIDLRYFHDALLLSEEMKRRAPDSHRPYLLITHILTGQNKLHEAILEYSQIVPKYNDYPSVVRNFALTKAKIKDPIVAQRYFETAVDFAYDRNYPGVAKFDLSAGLVDMLISLGRFDLAGLYNTELLDSLPTDFRALKTQAYIYWAYTAKGQLDTILPRVTAAVEGMPANMALLGQFYERMDSLDEAREYSRATLSADKSNLTAILTSIAILEKTGDPKGVLALLDNYDEHVSYVPEIAAQKIHAYRELGDLDSALKFARLMIDLGKKDLDRYKVAVEIAQNKNDAREAEEAVRLCTDNNPDDPGAYLIYGRYYFNRNDTNEAEKAVAKALALDSLHVDALTLKAELLETQGQTQEAIRLYKKVMEIDQYAGDAIGNLAMLLIDTDENPLVAANYANIAMMTGSDDAKYLYVLGRSYYKMGKYAMARSNFEKALLLAPDNPEYNYFAGMNYIKDGKPEKAKSCLKKSIRLGLHAQLRKEAENALKDL
jgi:tetratricopeptide (TPR) repeat protein